MTVRRFLPLGVIWVSIVFVSPAAAQAPGPMHVGRNVADVTFAPIPGLPTCATAAVQTGDPTKGPSIILSKIAAGCIVPWHWHSPNENLMLVSGVAKIESKDGAPFTLRAGGFAQLPSKHVHQFTCQQACIMYVAADGVFDTHYVNAAGAEISPAEALGAVKEKTVTP
jgi:quercetin dioxygenase-like cupin family protein